MALIPSPGLGDGAVNDELRPLSAAKCLGEISSLLENTS